MLMKQFYTQRTTQIQPKKETIQYLLDYSKQLKVLIDSKRRPIMLNLN